MSSLIITKKISDMNDTNSDVDIDEQEITIDNYCQNISQIYLLIDAQYSDMQNQIRKLNT